MQRTFDQDVGTVTEWLQDLLKRLVPRPEKMAYQITKDEERRFVTVVIYPGEDLNIGPLMGMRGVMINAIRTISERVAMTHHVSLWVDVGGVPHRPVVERQRP